MKIAICDDRENDRGALKALLEAYGRDFEMRKQFVKLWRTIRVR